MAYGVIMGQTPILSASGIEYDNSQTASVITGNNVQQAIDESVKKIEIVENKVDSGVQWDLLVNKRVQGVENTTDGHIYPLIVKPLENIDLTQYGGLLLTSKVTISPPQEYFRLYCPARFNELVGSEMSKGRTLSLFALNNGLDGFTTPNRNDDNITNDSNLTMNYGSSTTEFNYDVTFQIYGLKAPI